MRSAAALAATGTVGGLTAGCDSGDRAGRRLPVEPAGGDLLVVDTATGLTVLTTGGRAVVPAGPGVLDAAATRVIRTEVRAGRTELTGLDVRGGVARWQATLTGDLAARATSPDGRLVALATPAGPGGTVYRPGGRERTTLVVADDGGERVRVELPGNLEPEAFSATGGHLFVLDYLPPAAPDRYRVRMVNLATRQLEPMLTRLKSAVPPGAEEEMRGEGRHAVYDAGRQLLFTLYTHQPDHLHTRDLLAGARPGAAHVHAFVHTLSLREQWAYCVDLPAPFGEGPPGRHAIALSPRGNRLAVVETGSGTVAEIDPDGLNVTRLTRFAPPAGGPGETAARFAPDDRLIVAAGREVLRLVPTGGKADRWASRSAVRGLAPHPDGDRVYVGQDGAVVCHDLASGREVSRTAAPGLRALRDLVT